MCQVLFQVLEEEMTVKRTVVPFLCMKALCDLMEMLKLVSSTGAWIGRIHPDSAVGRGPELTA